MKNLYKVMRFGLLVFFLLSGYLSTAQERPVKGKVTDAQDGTPIPGVNILIKGKSTGSVTDINGDYQVETTDGDVLVFSFVGYVTEEVPVGSQSVINVQLSQNVKELQEIVVIGYGEVKKEDLTGSVTSVTAEDFNKGVITTPQDLLMGKAAGVVITSGGGAAGSGSTIRIRGGSSLKANNDPLIVVDGIPLENTKIAGMANPLSTINPNDIESFNILKDASATAIYGSRASNGVVIITTKKGSEGELKLSYNGNYSIGKPVKYMEVYSGDEFKAIVQDRVNNHGLASVALDRLGNANTDWQKEIYRNASSTDHNVSLSGALQSVPFRVSVGYTNQNGILEKNNIERTNIDLSINPSLFNDNLKVNLNAKSAFINNDFSNPDAIGSAVQFDPTQPVRNGNTRYGGYTAWTLPNSDPKEGAPINIATHNPVARIAFRDNTSTAKRHILGAKFDYSLPFVSGLKATLNLGHDYYSTEGHDITDTLASWSAREPENAIKNYNQTKKNTLLDLYFNYNKELNAINSNLDFTAGYSYQHFHNEGQDSNRPWLMTDGEYLGARTKPYKNEYFLLSFFGRLNYTFSKKYLLTLTLRNDGSSRFSEDNRWGLFPAAAFAWKINEEGFMKAIDVFDELKLRLGWGQTGQQDISDNYYPYIPTYTFSQQGAYYQFGNSYYRTQRPDPYDANIKWETTTTQNVGLDFGFLNNRINGFVDLYKRVTKDLLNEAPIPAGTNFSNFLITNVGSLENKGVEFGLNGFIISKPDVSWELSTNFTYNKNEITKLTLVDDPSYPGYEVGGISGGVDNKVQKQAVGYASNTFFLFRQVYDQDGKPIQNLYVDKTGEGGNVTGNELNKYYMKKAAPDYLIGLSSKATFGQVDFSFSGRFNIGNYVYNNNASDRALYQHVYNQSGYTSNILRDIEKTNFTTAQYWSDIYLENASFFRMDNISLGYNFNEFLSNSISGRLALIVQNAFVVTKYSGLDPEVDGGIDNNIYPRPRTFMLGLNLNF